MKKLFFLLFVVCILAFASCGSGKAPADTNDSTKVEQADTTAPVPVTDTVVAQ